MTGTIRNRQAATHDVHGVPGVTRNPITHRNGNAMSRPTEPTIISSQRSSRPSVTRNE